MADKPIPLTSHNTEKKEKLTNSLISENKDYFSNIPSVFGFFIASYVKELDVPDIGR